MNEKHKELLKNIQMERMRTKSSLDKLRFIQQQTGISCENGINQLLDYLNQLDELEKKLKD